MHFRIVSFKVLAFYHLMPEDKNVNSLDLPNLPKTLKAKSSFQTSRRYLNDWLGPKWISLLTVSKNDK